MRGKRDIDKEIMKILTEAGRPLSASEVQKELEKRGIKITYAWTKTKLDRMVARGEIDRLRIGRRDKYGLKGVVATLDRFIKYETADEDEKTRLLDDLSKEDIDVDELAVFEDAISPWLEIVHLWKDVIEPVINNNEIIINFINTEPLNFFIELINRATTLSQELYQKFLSESNIRVRRRIQNRSRILKTALRRLFAYLGLPQILLDFDARRGIVIAKIADQALLEKMLKENIIGNKMIDVIYDVYETKDNSKEMSTFLISTGVDGTRFIVPPGLFLRRFRPVGPLLESPPIYIHAAVSCWLDVVEGEIKAFDPRPLPEHWADYKRIDAEEEGFIVTPASLQEMDQSLWKRAGEAALDAVEYRKLKEAFLPPKDLLGTESPYVSSRPLIAFLDGRIFPYEFRFDDYLHDHGKFVQAAFINMADLIAGNDLYNQPENPRTIICGVVKRSGLNVFKIILSFWLYMEGLIEEDTFWKIMDAPLTDGYLLWKIFSLIRSRLDEKIREGLLVTFRVRKPFYSMIQEVTILEDKEYMNLLAEESAEEKMKILGDLSLWEDALRRYARKRRMPEVDVGPYAVACTSAFILQFYCDAPYLSNLQDLILPRFEVLIPYRIARNRSQLLLFDHSVLIRMNLLFGRLKKSMVLYKIYEEDRERESRLVVPREVNSAHEWANQLGREYKTTIVGLLEEAFIRLITNRYRSLSSGSSS